MQKNFIGMYDRIFSEHKKAILLTRFLRRAKNILKFFCSNFYRRRKTEELRRRIKSFLKRCFKKFSPEKLKRKKKSKKWKIMIRFFFPDYFFVFAGVRCTLRDFPKLGWPFQSTWLLVAGKRFEPMPAATEVVTAVSYTDSTWSKCCLIWGTNWDLVCSVQQGNFFCSIWTY